MNTVCDINPSLSFTMNELQDEYPGGIIQALGTLPTLNADENLDPKFLSDSIQTLINNKVIPNLIPPQYPTFATPPPLPSPPQLPPASPLIPPECGMAGRPSPDGNIRLYTQDECNHLNGNWSANGECTRKTGGSFSAMCGVLNKSDGCGTYGFPAGNGNPIRMYGPDDCKKVGGVHKPWDMCYKDENIVASDSFSVKCAYLNNPTPDDATIKYQKGLTDYQNSLKSISDTKASYNAAVVKFNQDNANIKAAFNTEYCFYESRLKYAQKTFFISASQQQIQSNNKLVVYKNSIISKLVLKQLILTKIANQIFKNDITRLEGFTGSMVLSSSDISAQHTRLTTALTTSKLNQRMVAYTTEKNNANQNLLTLFGILNVVAIGIIYGIASS
jgi:hypothetical protein